MAHSSTRAPGLPPGLPPLPEIPGIRRPCSQLCEGKLTFDARVVVNRVAPLPQKERVWRAGRGAEREIFIDNPLVRIRLIIEIFSVDRSGAMGV